MLRAKSAGKSLPLGMASCLAELLIEFARLEFSRKSFLEDGLAEAGGALEVGGHHRLQLLHHAQPPLHFRHKMRPRRGAELVGGGPSRQGARIDWP